MRITLVRLLKEPLFFQVVYVIDALMTQKSQADLLTLDDQQLS